jgi:hypothetical protein
MVAVVDFHKEQEWMGIGRGGGRGGKVPFRTRAGENLHERPDQVCLAYVTCLFVEGRT